MTGPGPALAQPPAPRLFYGYVVVLAGFFIMIAYSAARTSYGIFFHPMADEFGWGSALTSGPLSLSIVIDGLLGIPMGRLTDRFGPRLVLTVCACLLGAGFILMSRITVIWQMYLVYGVLIGVGMGGVFVPVVTNISRWFIARRSTMNGLVLAGTGVGTLIVSPLTSWMIENYGWRTSYIVLGIAIFLIVFILAQFMRLDPQQIGQAPYSKAMAGKREIKKESRSYTFTEALKSRQFWLVFCMFFSFGFFAMSISVHIVPHVIHLQISAAIAASILATIGAVNIAGRLAFGAIGDKIGAKQAYGLGLVVMAAAVFWLISIDRAWLFFVFAVIYGFNVGGMGSVQAPIVAELFGLKYHGAIFGACGLGTMIGASIGPVLVGYLFDLTGSYRISFLTCGLVAVGGLLINLAILRRKGENIRT
jgi:MFS family permease